MGQGDRSGVMVSSQGFLVVCLPAMLGNCPHPKDISRFAACQTFSMLRIEGMTSRIPLIPNFRKARTSA